jgi:integrase/recombinase XerD
MAPGPLPTKGDAIEMVVKDVWRTSGRTPATVDVYLAWVRRYRREQIDRGASDLDGLTLEGARVFAQEYARQRRCNREQVVCIARSALRAWSYALRVLGFPVPCWTEPRPEPRLAPLLVAFREHRVCHSGISSATSRRDLDCASDFLEFIRSRGRRLDRLRLTDIDGFVQHLSERLRPKTVSGLCSALRAFLRFLQVSGRLGFDLASAMVGPRVMTSDRPPRTLPWQDVRRLLRTIDVRRPLGRRDFAMLLMMASYGLGAAEVRTLDLDDVDWKSRSIRVRRPKTGVVTHLPLLAGVARALADYLRRERPVHAESRALFVADGLPHRRLSGSHAIADRLARHAAAAGIDAVSTGAHVLRHTHASRQIDIGAPPKVVSDILGHRSSSSTSAYVRVALRRLRAVSLPVPR